MDQKIDEMKEYIKRLIISRSADDAEIIDRMFLLLEMFITREIEKGKER